MTHQIFKTKQEAGRAAAKLGAEKLRTVLKACGRASIIVATGASQFEMLEALVMEPGIPWDKVTGFHLDEYIGMPITHPASFRQYLWKRFVSHLPLPLRAFHYLDVETDVPARVAEANAAIARHPIDVAFVGIGENGHLAFNDPPADFQTQTPYLVVNLDEGCRRQQLGEGWFATLDDVPKQAVSMSCAQIMKSASIIVTCPDLRKAKAVAGALEGPVTPMLPASILQQHKDVSVFLDSASASLLSSR